MECTVSEYGNFGLREVLVVYGGGAIIRHLTLECVKL